MAKNNSEIKYQYQGKFNPDKLASDNIDRLSTQMIEPKTRVLELGCATGFMSHYLSQTKSCQVIGVDLNSEAIEQAKKHCHQTFVGDLDDEKLWQKLESIEPVDYVLASSVLEHTKDPWIILDRIYQIIRPKGHIVITMPNIAHWRARLHLLTGKWQYQDYGTFDRTHLRFFTYHSMQTLISEAGFIIDQVEIDPAGGIKYLNNIAKYWPNFYAHQVAIKAQRL